MLTQNTTIPMKKQVIITNSPINVLANKVALFTNARNEKHIKEWATHHLLIGFDNIIIFDHKSTIPLKKVFHKFDKRVKTIDVSNLENPIKMLLMNQAIGIAKQLNVDWFIYLDADEFIVLHNKFRGVKHLLNTYNHADLLAINWLMFGSNNLKKEPSGLIIENYTKSELYLTDLVKCFVRPNRAVNATNPHFYHVSTNNRCFSINGKLLNQIVPNIENKIEYYNSPAYIAHYVYQSEESFINRKVLLPRDDNAEFRFDNKEDVSYIHDSYNDVDNLQVKNKYAFNVNKFLEEKHHLL
jgi:hypothetical protein